MSCNRLKAEGSSIVQVRRRVGKDDIRLKGLLKLIYREGQRKEMVPAFTVVDSGREKQMEPNEVIAVHNCSTLVLTLGDVAFTSSLTKGSSWCSPTIRQQRPRMPSANDLSSRDGLALQHHRFGPSLLPTTVCRLWHVLSRRIFHATSQAGGAETA